MKNELMARAISDIAPDLLEEAAEITPVPAKGGKGVLLCRFTAAVACAALFGLGLWQYRLQGPTVVTVNGQAIGPAGCAVYAAEPADSESRCTECTTVVLELNRAKTLAAVVQGGELRAESAKTGAVLMEGTAGEVTGPAVLYWTVTDCVPGGKYFLQLGQSERFCLTYNGNSRWTIKKL